MYAIIADGGRQYRVEEGQELRVDYRDIPAGHQVQFDQVLALRNEDGLLIGRPTIDGAAVTGQVMGPELGKKLVVQKLRRRKNSRRRTGHRQLHTRVRIDKIQG